MLEIREGRVDGVGLFSENVTKARRNSTLAVNYEVNYGTGLGKLTDKISRGNSICSVK